MIEHQPIRWSEGGLIQFIDGNAYSLFPSGITVCIGSEEKIRKALENKTKTGNRQVNEILRKDIELAAVDKILPQATKSTRRARKVKVNRR